MIENITSFISIKGGGRKDQTFRSRELSTTNLCEVQIVEAGRRDFVLLLSEYAVLISSVL